MSDISASVAPSEITASQMPMTRHGALTGKQKSILSFLGISLFVVFLLAAGMGAYKIAPWKIPSHLWARDEGFMVLWYIRFPRVFLGLLVGMSLGVAGSSLQGLFRNPLADPGLLGINAGASLGAAIWLVFVGSGILGLWGVSLSAFLGAWLVLWLAWRLSHSGGQVLVATLLLAGIAMNSFAGAGIGMMSFLADEQQLRSLTFWLLGGLGGGTWPLVGVVAFFSLCGLLLQLRWSSALDLMTLGEADAFHLGVDTQRVKRWLVLGATLGVSTSVAAAGGIGFIGLVIPHLMRMWGGANHRYVMCASALGGALLLLLADLVARMLVSPAEIPVGIVTSLLGAPFLTWLLIRNRREVFYA